MDALSDVLRTMRLKGGVFLHGEYFAPWCLSVRIEPGSCAPYLGETAHVIPYHYVLEGSLHLRMPDGSDLQVGPGETVMFPRNDPHLMGSDLAHPPVDSDSVVQPGAPGALASIRLGDGGERTRIVCGFLGAEDILGNPVIGALPAALRLAARQGAAGDWIRSSFHHAAEQIAAGRTGSEAMMSKLSELLCSGRPIQRIAQQAGYESEAAFTRAFKRVMGAPPAAWRRRRLDS